MNADSNYFSAYLTIRNTIDTLSKKLSLQHQSHLQCRKGCDLCCMDYSILPVEFHSIREELKKEGFQNEPTGADSEQGGCRFLKDSTCTIYHHRPVICRTHGLPLLFTNDDYEWELSTCELNFRQFDYQQFTPENTFPQDTFNSQLFMLNKEFIAACTEKKYGEFELIPLQNLLQNL